MRKYKTNNTNTQQTIQQLRESIDSMQKMIEKSHKILVNTKVISHKQVKSDSIELRLNSKGRKKNNNNSVFNTIQTSKIQPLNTLNRSLQENQISRVTQLKTPQKTKPFKFKQRLRINTCLINDDHQKKQKILICQQLSPITKQEDKIKRNYFDSSFASSLDQGYLKRFKTQGFIDSRQDSLMNQSVEKKTNQATQVSQKPKIILKKKKDRMINNMKDLQRQNQKGKRNKIFGNQKQGKYSYVKGDLTKKQIKQVTKRNQNKCFRGSTIHSSGDKCMKNQKQNCKMDLDEFIKKVKKYGFIQRYLSHSQICSIYNYLKKSSIPQYKWPLFVVDEVYQKMQSPKLY